jgi:hypothetical protein
VYSIVRFAFLCLFCVIATSARAQQPMPMPMPMPMPGGDQHMMPMSETPLDVSHTRDASGTSWLPDASPMMGTMRSKGPWTLMLHGNVFLQFIKTGSTRGDEQFGSLNWGMGTAQRSLWRGQFSIRSMLTLEPLTVGRCGYPTLLATGEECRGAALHDQQHPHDLFMELAVQYKRALNDSVAFELYGGPSAEPALGPTAFMHRLSALPNPIAPVAHHWLDSTHISFGVVTGGLFGRKWKAEASVFNGREPDDQRYNIDTAALDSYSGRFWLTPTPAWSFQVSAGHLTEAEHHDEGDGDDMNRVTASATYHRLVNDRLWATTVAWGRNTGHGQPTAAFVGETAVDMTTKDVLYARGEIIQKTADDLVVDLAREKPFTLSKLQIGYTRWLVNTRGLKAGIGGSVGLSLLPGDLDPFYGGTKAGEMAVYFTLQPR